MIAVRVDQVSLAGRMHAQNLAEADFVEGACPICGSAAQTTLLAEVRAGARTSLESAFCRPCEHRYFRKLPSPAWLASYYASTWDQGISGPSPRRPVYRAATDRLRRYEAGRWLTGRIQRWWSGEDATTRLRSKQLPALLLGVTEEGGIYSADGSVRKVLEIGCGYGDTLELFRRAGRVCYGVEASERRAAVCRSRGLNVIDASPAGWAALRAQGPFDLAYSCQVLEHIPDPSAHLADVAGLLRPGGWLFIEVPNPVFEVNFVHQSHTPVHCQSFSPRSLQLALRGAGFVPVRLQVDMNVCVLARKDAGGAGGLPLTMGTLAPADLLSIFRGLRDFQDRPLRLSWDHAYATVHRVGDAACVWEQPVPFAVAALPARHTMTFSFEAGNESEGPVVFRHPGETPPVWIKKI